jgi:hypothetical protein
LRSACSGINGLGLAAPLGEFPGLGLEDGPVGLIGPLELP